MSLSLVILMSEETVQEINVPLPPGSLLSGEEPPEREDIIGDDYAVVYTRTYNRETKKFSTYFWLNNYRKDTEKGVELKKLLDQSEVNKPVEFDGFFFTKYITKGDKPKTMVFKKTREEQSQWKGYSKPLVKKKIKQITTLTHSPEHDQLEDINYKLSEEGGNWDLFAVSPLGDGKTLVYTLSKT